MASAKAEIEFTLHATKRLTNLAICTVLCLGSAVCAQAQNPQPNDADRSSIATTKIDVEHTNPMRTIESHTTAGSRTMDKQRVELLGLDGRYQPDSETETETVQVNASTTRTLVRTYRWDGNGQRKLAQVTEEEARSSASGDAQVVRTTSNSDVNGNLQVVQRDVVDTRKTNPDERETKTTTYIAGSDGGFTKSAQTQELQTRSADHRLSLKTTTLLPDGNGGWQVSEVREQSITENGKSRTTEESVLRPDLEGRLSEYSRKVGRETETAGGKSSAVDTYSTVVTGVAGDGRLHLNERVTTVQKKDSDGETTEQQVQQPNPGNPNTGLQVSGKTKYTVLYGSSGTHEKTTVQARDANGNFNVVSVETKESQPTAPAQAATPSPDKPQ